MAGRVLRALTRALALALVLPPVARGQTLDDVDPRVLGNGPLLLELPVSTRAMALGDAWAGDAADAVFYHPALMTGSGSALAYQTYGGAGVHLTLGGEVEWLDGTVGFGVAVLEHGAATASVADLRRDEASLVVDGAIAASAFTAAAGYAREVAGSLRAGVVARVVGMRLGAARATVPAVDLGVGMEAGPVTVALSAQNLGPELELGDETLPLAHRITLGAFTERHPVGPLDLGLAVRVSRDGEGDILPGGGLEIAWWPVVGRTFLARIGARRVVDGSATPLTFGGGFAGDRIRIDYAYQGMDSLEGSHRFGLSFR